MHQSVNGFDLASNVKFLDGVVEIFDSRMFLITTKDVLGLFSSIYLISLVVAPTYTIFAYLSGLYTSSTVKMAKCLSSRKSRRAKRAPGLTPSSSIFSCERSRVIGMLKRLPSASRLFSTTLYSC
jgi:hypothetical protein